jgi:hypothetical protein
VPAAVIVVVVAREVVEEAPAVVASSVKERIVQRCEELTKKPRDDEMHAGAIVIGQLKGQYRLRSLSGRRRWGDRLRFLTGHRRCGKQDRSGGERHDRWRELLSHFESPLFGLR